MRFSAGFHIIQRMPETRPKTRLVLFDLDETLFDHSHASRCGLKTLQDEYDGFGAPSLDELESTAFEILNRTHRKILSGVLTQEEGCIERFRLLAEWCGSSLGEDEIQAASRRYRQVYRSSRRAMSGAIELLKCLRERVTVGIVTNNFVREQKSKLADCELDPWIDFMVTSEETGQAKPAAEIFHKALETTGASPDEAVMIGDSWEVDIIGAKAVGIRPVWYNPAATEPPAGEAVSELRSFLPTSEALEIVLPTA